jgi:hypothetical protein
MAESETSQILQRLDSLDKRITDVEMRLVGRIARVVRFESEMSRGLTQLTWAVNLSGSVITVLLVIALVRV